jgi:hypothetical protein
VSPSCCPASAYANWQELLFVMVGTVRDIKFKAAVRACFGVIGPATAKAAMSMEMQKGMTVLFILENFNFCTSKNQLLFRMD